MPASTLSAPNPIKDIYKKLVFFDVAHVSPYRLMYTDASTLYDVSVTEIRNDFLFTEQITLGSTIKNSDDAQYFGANNTGVNNNSINIGQLHSDIYGILSAQQLKDNYKANHQYEDDWDGSELSLMDVDHLEHDAREAKDLEQDFEFDKIQLGIFGTAYAPTAYGGATPTNPYNTGGSVWGPDGGFIKNDPTNVGGAAATTMLTADSILDAEIEHNRTWLETLWNYLIGTDTAASFAGAGLTHPGSAVVDSPSTFDGSEWKADGYYITGTANTANPARIGGSAGPALALNLYQSIQRLDTESYKNEVWLNAINKWVDSSDVDNPDQSIAWVAPTDNWGEFSGIAPAGGLTYTKDAIAGTASINAMDAIKHLDMNMRHLRYLIDKNADEDATYIDDDGGADWIKNTARRGLLQLRQDVNAISLSTGGGSDATDSATWAYASTGADSYANQGTIHGDISEIDAQLEDVTSILTGAQVAGTGAYATTPNAGNVEADIELIWDELITEADSVKIKAGKIVDNSLNLVNASGGSFAMGSQKITGVVNPTDGQDAATKDYVDTALTGFTVGHQIAVSTFRLGDNVGITASESNTAPGGGIMAVDTSVGGNWANAASVTLDSVAYDHGGIRLNPSTYQPDTTVASGVYIDGHLMIEGELIILTEEGATTEDGVLYDADPTATNLWSSGHAPDEQDWHWRNGVWVFHYSDVNSGNWERPSAGDAVWKQDGTNSISDGMLHPAEYGKDEGDNDVIWVYQVVAPEETFSYPCTICETRTQADTAFDAGKQPRCAIQVFGGTKIFNAGEGTVITGGDSVDLNLIANKGLEIIGSELGAKLSTQSGATDGGVLEVDSNGLGLNFDTSYFANSSNVLTMVDTVPLNPSRLIVNTNTLVANKTSFDNLVGIGNASPTHRLTVSRLGSAPAIAIVDAAPAIIFADNEVDHDNFTIINDNDNLKINTSTLTDGTGTTVLMTINQTGKIGIGTEAPAQLLDITSTAATIPEIRIARGTASDTMSIVDDIALGGIGWYAHDADATLGSQGAAISCVTAGTWSSDTNDAPTEMTFWTQSIGGDNGMGAPRMIIAQSGNIGIGTASPLVRLDVADANNPTIAITNGPTNEIVDGEVIGRLEFRGVDATIDSPNIGIGARIEVEASGDWDSSNKAKAGANMKFYVNNTDTSHEIDNAINQKMTILSDGSVGIGNPTPNHTLSVTLADTTTAHFGNGEYGVDEWSGISLGYRSSVDDFLGHIKAKIVQEGIGDGNARGNLHFLVDTTDDNGSAVIADSKLMIHGLTGHVGIGTVDPSTHLEIEDAGGANIMLTRGSDTIVPDDVIGTLIFAGADPSGEHTGAFIRAICDRNHWEDHADNKSTSLNFYTQDDNDAYDTLATPRMTIDRDGKVGIGTNAAAPTEMFEVSLPSGANISLTRDDSDIDSGDHIGALYFKGRHGGEDKLTAGIHVTALADWVAGGAVQGSKMSFHTQSNNATDDYTKPAMTIDENGRLGIGEDSPYMDFHVSASAAPGMMLTDEAKKALGHHGAHWAVMNNSSTFMCISYDHDGTNGASRFSISPTGTFTGAATANISDKDLKEDIKDITGGLDTINKLQGRTFNWKESAQMPEGPQYGLIAQELEGVLPDLVNNTSEFRVVNGRNAKSINMSGVIPVLIEAVKELSDKVDGKIVINATVEKQLPPDPPQDWSAELRTWQGIARGLEQRIKVLEKQIK